MTAALDFLGSKAQGWKIPAATLATASAQVKEILAFFTKVYPQDAGGTLRVSFNGLDFGIAVACSGDRVPAVVQTAPPPAIPASGLDNEEAAAVRGLRDFLRSLTADRKRAKQRGGQITISLFYVV